MTVTTFDPFAVERPILRLGEHGSWELGDITDARKAKLEALQSELLEIGDRSDASVADVARVVGDLCEAACRNADGISDLLVDLADCDKHGEDAIGALALKGVAEFVKDHLRGEVLAGEG